METNGSPSSRHPHPRSVLYARPESAQSLDAAAATGADAVLINLEKTAHEDRPGIRQVMADWIPTHDANTCRIWVKLTDDEAELDVAALSGPVDEVMLPDAEVENTQALSAVLESREAALGLEPGSIGICALIESARGLLEARELASLPRVTRIGIGRVDLMNELRITADPEGPELAGILLDLVVASAAAGIAAPIAPLYRQKDDEAGLRATTERLRSLGFMGRTAIFPEHVATLNEVFSA